MTVEDEDDYVAKLDTFLEKKGKLIREKRFEELSSLLDDMYGKDSDQRHARECEITWEKGDRERALDEIISRLEGGSYTVSHIIMAARYTFVLKRIDAADFLKLRFKSKFDEESSQLFIEYVYNSLRNLPTDSDMNNVAKMMM